MRAFRTVIISLLVGIPLLVAARALGNGAPGRYPPEDFRRQLVTKSAWPSSPKLTIKIDPTLQGPVLHVPERSAYDWRQGDAGSISPTRTIVAGCSMSAAIAVGGLFLAKRRLGARTLTLILSIGVAGSVVCMTALGNISPYRVQPDMPHPLPTAGQLMPLPSVIQGTPRLTVISTGSEGDEMVLLLPMKMAEEVASKVPPAFQNPSTTVPVIPAIPAPQPLLASDKAVLTSPFAAFPDADDLTFREPGHSERARLKAKPIFRSRLKEFIP